MKSFEDKLFDMVGNDNDVIPNRINNKIDRILDDLPHKPKCKRRMSAKTILLVATITILSTTTIIANSYYDFFNTGRKSIYDSNKDNIDNLGIKIEKSSTDKGITYMVDSISVDENYMYIKYNIESSENLKKIFSITEENRVFEEFISCYERVYIDGEEVSMPSQRSGYYVNDNLYTGIVRFSIIDKDIKDKFELKLVVDKIGNNKGTWIIESKINRKDTKDLSKIVDLNKEYEVNFGDRKEKFVINKVVLSPLGNQILITNKGRGIDTNFMLFDDKGNELELVYDQVAGNETGETKNVFDFVNTNKDIEYINFVPCRLLEGNPDEAKEMIYDITNLPVNIKTSPNGEVTIKNIEVDKNKLKIMYTVKGEKVVPTMTFLDDTGNAIGATLLEDVDKVTGIHVDTHIYNTDIDLNKIKKVRVFYRGNSYELLEDQAIKIPLK